MIPPPRNRAPLPLVLLLLPTVLYLSFHLAPVFGRARLALSYPFQLDAEEGFVYEQAQRLAEGESIYTPVEQSPWLVGNYPPLYPWILSRMIGPGRYGLPLGRLVSLLGGCAVMQCLVMIVFARTRRVLPALLAPLLFAVSYEFHQWIAFCRVDLTALGLTMIGMMIFTLHRARPVVAAAALFFVAAAFTRQTEVLAPLACSLVLLVRDRRRFLWFFPVWAGVGGGVFLALNHLTRGEFLRHTVLYNRNEMNWHAWRMVMRNEIWYFQRGWIVALAGGVICLAAMRFFAKPSVPDAAESSDEAGTSDADGADPAAGVFGLYALLSGLSLASMAKVGSAPNYVLAPLAAAAMFGTILLGRLMAESSGPPSRRRRIARIGFAVMALGLLGHTARLNQVGAHLLSSRNPNREDFRVGEAVLSTVHTAAGRILTEYPIHSILAGREVFYEPFIMSRLEAEGIWDPEPVLEEIRRGAYPLIITSQDLREPGLMRFTPRMAETITSHYRLRWLLGGPTVGGGGAGGTDAAEGGRGMPGLGDLYYIWTPVDREPPAETPRDIS